MTNYEAIDITERLRKGYIDLGNLNEFCDLVIKSLEKDIHKSVNIEDTWETLDNKLNHIKVCKVLCPSCESQLMYNPSMLKSDDLRCPKCGQLLAR